MKKFLVPLLLAVIFMSCNNERKDSSASASDDPKPGIEVEKVKDAAADMEAKKEELSNLTPLTAAEMTALIPKEMMGVGAMDIDVSSAMGASLANAVYKVNDSTEIEISIIDCAGAAGAGIYNLQFVSMFGFEEDEEDEYTKTIDFNGGKALEHCSKERPECTITFFNGGRFLVTLEGENVPVEKLKEEGKGLRLNR